MPVYTTSMPASRSARATTFAPRSCPSSPGLPTSTRAGGVSGAGPIAGSSPVPLAARSAILVLAAPRPSRRRGLLQLDQDAVAGPRVQEGDATLRARRGLAVDQLDAAPGQLRDGRIDVRHLEAHVV